ncbi:UDPGP type 1 family protein [bacterium]|nr:UDPGP type 1 family protein [bacterium]
MSALISPYLAEQLTAAGQTHLIEHARRLPVSAQTAWVKQLLEVDWELVTQLIATAEASQQDSTESVRELAARAQPPDHLVCLPQTEADRQQWQAMRERGEDWLRAGKVGVVVVAGGQGSRLGFDAPKGMFPFGTITGKSLYQWFCEHLRALRQRYGQPIPYAVMTSDATHADSAAFFAQHNHFGLPESDLRLFQQGSLPAVDIATRQVLLAGPDQLALSPDGHGGMLIALARENILNDWRSRGIETLFYHQVDNPATPLCDPAFIGWHLDRQADVSTKVVSKTSAQEKMGLAVSVDGLTRIIEYSDLPADAAAQTDAQGGLRLWAGNTAIHLFQREFLEHALIDEHAMPFHIARKVSPYWDCESRQTVTPETANAFKFERFIFDVLPWAKTALVVEGRRADEFLPIKNADGPDSPQTARAAMMARQRCWLRDCGCTIGDDVPVEISPLVATSAAELQNHVSPGMIITEPFVLEATGN